MSKTDIIMRGIITFAIEEQRNRGLEEAALLVEQVLRSDRFVLSNGAAELSHVLPQSIRARKRSAVSCMAEAKVASGKLAGLLPAPDHTP